MLTASGQDRASEELKAFAEHLKPYPPLPRSSLPPPPSSFLTSLPSTSHSLNGRSNPPILLPYPSLLPPPSSLLPPPSSLLPPLPPSHPFSLIPRLSPASHRGQRLCVTITRAEGLGTRLASLPSISHSLNGRSNAPPQPRMVLSISVVKLNWAAAFK